MASTCFNHVFQVFWAWWSPIWRIWWSCGLRLVPTGWKSGCPVCSPERSRKPWTFAWWVPLEREIDDVDICWYYIVYIYIYTNYSICWYRWWYNVYSIWCIHNPYRWMMIDDGISIAGWWFQTWILFSIIYGIILPIDFHIFQDV